MSVKGSEAFSGFTIFVVFVTRTEVSNHWGSNSRSLRACIDLHWFLFYWRIWPFLLFIGRTCRTWTILWTRRLLLSKSGMPTPELMAVDNDNNVKKQCRRRNRRPSRSRISKSRHFGWRSKLPTCSFKGCPHLIVLFDLIAGLCFHKRDHFLSLCNQCVYIHFPCPWVHST